MPLNQLNIRTEEIDEILGKTPNKIIRWGVSLIFIIVVLLLFGSWFFKYPDFINSTIEITTLDPPADVVAKTNGRIDSLYVVNNEPISENRVLAIIENPAVYKDVLLVKSILDSLEISLLESQPITGLQALASNGMNLGELQSYYSGFISNYNEYRNYTQLNYYDKKIDAIRQQIQDYKVYYGRTTDQKQTMMLDFQLAEKDYKRNQILFESLTILEAELEKSQSQYLSKKNAFESINTSLANINIQISQLENNILDLQLQDRQHKENLLISVNESYNNLKAQIAIWEQRYVLIAPISGICIFTKYWSENQHVVSGEKVITIVPKNTEKIIGKLLLPVTGAGKVKKGQRVNIKLSNFPYMEFGMLEGFVQNISSIPSENFYYVEVSFPNGIKTSYGVDIPFSQNMQGSAEIVTEDIRLLYRLMQPIRSILTEQKRYSLNHGDTENT
ncbi:MAG: HlyD family efflux transporter periplasmic adaptor subunit [Bacteroidales bacterium]|nr:HlyD family efflux transporter periplasmic adaptor subunit [Bacteroidales bacterium]